MSLSIPGHGFSAVRLPCRSACAEYLACFGLASSNSASQRPATSRPTACTFSTQMCWPRFSAGGFERTGEQIVQTTLSCTHFCAGGRGFVQGAPWSDCPLDTLLVQTWLPRPLWTPCQTVLCPQLLPLALRNHCLHAWACFLLMPVAYHLWSQHLLLTGSLVVALHVMTLVSCQHSQIVHSVREIVACWNSCSWLASFNNGILTFVSKVLILPIPFSLPAFVNVLTLYHRNLGSCYVMSRPMISFQLCLDVLLVGCLCQI